MNVKLISLWAAYFILVTVTYWSVEKLSAEIQNSVDALCALANVDLDLEELALLGNADSDNERDSIRALFDRAEKIIDEECDL